MSISLVTHTIAGSTDESNVTTSALDTTGATFIAIWVVSSAAFADATPTDSKGNTWIRGPLKSGSSHRIRFWYCNNPTVGSGHTFTHSAGTSSCSIGVSAWTASGDLHLFTSATGQASGNVSTATITPVSDDNLYLLGFGFGGVDGAPSSVSVDDGFTVFGFVPLVSGDHYGAAHCYLIQPTGAAVNPVGTFSGAGGENIAINVLFSTETPVLPSSAEYITTDATTSGSWIGVYGSDGYVFPDGVPPGDVVPPSYLSGFSVIESDFTAASQYNWGAGGQTKRLQDINDIGGFRYGCTWYDASGQWIEIAFDVGATARRVAFYFLDDDNLARADDITAFDTVTSTPLDSLSVSGFADPGKWVIFEVTGAVTFRVTKTGGANPTVSAIMFDPAPVSDSLEQYAYRWRNDDGDEDAATWKAAENTDTSIAKNTAVRLRMGLNATGDQPSQQFKLQYRKVGDTEWRDIKQTE